MTQGKKPPQLFLAFPDDSEASEPIQGANAPEPSANARPWSRFFARSIDITLCSFLFALILSYLTPSFFLDLPDPIFVFIFLFLWIFVETILLTTWGTTPGKRLLNIRIKTTNDKKPQLLNAFRRSIKVWFFGMAMGIPFIAVFTLFCAYFELNKNKITTWDKSENFTITHQSISMYKIIIAVLILGIPIVLTIYELYASQ
ncbi:RDD family protein [Legionella sp. WA2022007384]